jgi:hypothetical protein
MLALAFAVTACGSSDTSETSGDAGGAPRRDASSSGDTGDGGDSLAPDDAGVVEVDACDGNVSYVIPFVHTPNGLSDGLSLNVSIGGGASHEVMLDTGSEALIVPKSALGPDVQTPSPSQRFTYEYTSNGLTLTGEIVMAAVACGVSNAFTGGATRGVPRTVSMPVRVVESASCDSVYPHCRVPSSLSTIGMLGVGFGRDSNSDPSSNALLQIEEVIGGTMRPGYVISNHPPQLTVGIPASTTDFTRLALTPASNGDWLAASFQGCARLPAIPWSLCGTLLVDTGIDYSLISVPSTAMTPYDGGTVPTGSEIDFLAPADGSAMTSVANLGASSLQTPPTIEFRHPPDATPLINTGRRVLALYDYLFDAKSGAVGFRKVAP